jgi:FKBP-type peptidyl-prolyl cis-trans isomerase
MIATIKIKYHISTLVLLVVGMFVFNSCESNNTKPKANIEQYKKPLEHINKKLVDKESEAIDNWVRRNKVTAISTGTGLRYAIIKKGNGNMPKDGEVAIINYKVSLLDGTVCYTSEKNKPAHFLIGHDNVESGLHEGILLMSVGDRGIFIMPPHLAHGLTGDDSKIPPLAILVFDVELISIKN